MLVLEKNHLQKRGERGGGEEEVLVEEDIYIDLWD